VRSTILISSVAKLALGIGDSFLTDKLAGREADHSSPSSAEVKKMWI
jgi:hypothetical protein